METNDMQQFAQMFATAFATMQGATSQNATSQNAATPNVSQETKRGRGRPPKNAPVTNATAKRGRGRPPKGAVIVNTTIHKVKDNKVLTTQELENEKMRGVVESAQERAQAKIQNLPVNGRVTKVLFTACVKADYKGKLRNIKVIALGNAYFPYDVRRETIGAPISEKTMARYYKLRHNSDIEIPAQFAKILVVE